MNLAATWNVRGVRQEVQEAAREAADRSGQSVGEWLNTTILDLAEEAGVSSELNESEPSAIEIVNERLDELAGQIERLTRFAPDAALTSPRLAPAVQGSEDIVTALRALEARLTAIDGHLLPRSEAAVRKIAADIFAALRKLEARLAARVVEQIAPVLRAIESRLKDFEERANPGESWHDGSDERRGAAAADLLGLEQQLRHITLQLETMRRPCAFEDNIVALRSELAEISRALTQAVPRRALEAVEAEVRALAERIDRDRHLAANTVAVSAIERGLAEVREVLRTLAPAESLTEVRQAVEALTQRIETISDSGSGAASLQNLEAAVGELRGIAARTASGETLRALGREVEKLAERMQSFASNAAPEAGVETIFAAIDEKLETLTALVEERRDSDALQQIEGQFTRLAEKFDAMHHRLDRLGIVERGVAELLAHLQDIRLSAIEAAEQAARTAAPGASSEELEGLKQDFNALRETHSAGEQRTQDSLEAVHGTLERLVERLAMVETEMRAESVFSRTPAIAAESFQQDAAALSSARAARTRLAELAAQSDPRAQDQASTSAVYQSPAGDAAPSVDDLPQETVVSPLSRAESEEHLLPAGEPFDQPFHRSSLQPSSKADFIAAARRAAQTATETKESAQRHAARPAGSALSLVRDALKGRRRPFLLVLGALLFVMGGVYLAPDFAGAPASTHVDRPSTDPADFAVLDEVSGATSQKRRTPVSAAEAMPPLASAANPIAKALQSPKVARFLDDHRDRLRPEHRQQLDQFLARHGIAGAAGSLESRR